MSAPARLGRYRVERRVGSGSFATVWLARDEVLDAPVAVKVLADNWAHRLDVRERFAEEARILRRADSDRVVRVHDIGELDDGRPYFVMTYADRGTLADRLADGPLPVPEALRYGADVARGLAVLHEVGVIHRDVTPANVLLRSGRGGAGDRVLIADLGLAKAAAQGSGFTLTVGTPGYMAPEQAAGSGVTKRTDVYAVGALLWHLLTGAPPEPDGPLPAGAVPGPVDGVLRQALARRPEDRFPSAGALADALDVAAIELARAPAPVGRVGHDDPDATDVVAPDPSRAAGAGGPGRAGPSAGGAGQDDPDGTGVVAPGPDRAGSSVGPAGPAGRVGPVGRLGPERRVGRPAPVEAFRSAGEPDVTQVLRLDRPDRAAGAATARPPRRRRRRVAWVLLLVLLLAGGGAAAYLLVERARRPVDVTAAGLHVRVPAGWARQQQAGNWDLSPLGAPGRHGTALLVAADVAGWRDPAAAVPGVFVGTASGLSPDRLWAASAVSDCPYVQDSRHLPSGLAGTVRRHDCAGSPVRVTEAVLTRAGSDLAVFVQVKEPVAADDAAAVLAGVTVS